jgi:TRAP-type C4-dicarboxylate transport system substrate-binding protein
MMEIWDKYSKPAGFKILGSAISIANDGIWSKRAVRTLGDFKGLKTRTSGRTQTSTLRALGGSPITLSMAEVEEALFRGTVDAVCTSISYGAERGLIDLVNYVSIWPVTPVFPQFVAINLKTWDKLDPFLQEGLLKAGAELTNEAAMVVEQMAISYALWIRSSKCEMIIPEKSEIDKAMKLMQPVVDEWLKTAGPYGKDVLRIALDYAKGPAVSVVAEAVK